jgi:hypothetical protein
MSETIHERWARQDREGRAMAAMLRSAPHQPLATRAEVLAAPCPFCEAAPGEECRTAFPRPAFFAGLLFGSEFSGVHLGRYQAKTRDPR